MSDVKQGVFISHISEEQEAAHLLKFYLRRSLGEDLPVFVSSDYDSIAGGDIWFQTIIKGLNTAAVVIVLLSPASNDRRWINFEAGVGVGAGATVIPVVVHGQQRSTCEGEARLQMRQVTALSKLVLAQIPPHVCHQYPPVCRYSQPAGDARSQEHREY